MKYKIIAEFGNINGLYHIKDIKTGQQHAISMWLLPPNFHLGNIVNIEISLDKEFCCPFSEEHNDELKQNNYKFCPSCGGKL